MGHLANLQLRFYTVNQQDSKLETNSCDNHVVDFRTCVSLKVIYTAVVVIERIYTDIKLDDCDKSIQTDCK